VLYAGGITKGALFMKGNKQTGFSIVEAVLALVIVGALAATGVFVYQHNQTKVTDAAPNNQPDVLPMM
jgi:Tfp pilus assembly protein PilV